jgi:hypothetical protein
MPVLVKGSLSSTSSTLCRLSWVGSNSAKVRPRRKHLHCPSGDWLRASILSAEPRRRGIGSLKLLSAKSQGIGGDPSLLCLILIGRLCDRWRSYLSPQIFHVCRLDASLGQMGQLKGISPRPYLGGTKSKLHTMILPPATMARTRAAGRPSGQSCPIKRECDKIVFAIGPQAS